MDFTTESELKPKEGRGKHARIPQGLINNTGIVQRRGDDLFKTISVETRGTRLTLVLLPGVKKRYDRLDKTGQACYYARLYIKPHLSDNLDGRVRLDVESAVKFPHPRLHLQISGKNYGNLSKTNNRPHRRNRRQ